MAVSIVICLFYRVDKMYPAIMKGLEEREARGEM